MPCLSSCGSKQPMIQCTGVCGTVHSAAVLYTITHMVVTTNKKSKEKHRILLSLLSSSLCILLCKIASIYFYCLFNLVWHCFCGGCFPQFLAFFPMFSFFPMLHLAIATAILHRVAQFAGFQWAQRCFGFAASGAAKNGGGGSSFFFV